MQVGAERSEAQQSVPEYSSLLGFAALSTNLHKYMLDKKDLA